MEDKALKLAENLKRCQLKKVSLVLATFTPEITRKTWQEPLRRMKAQEVHDEIGRIRTKLSSKLDTMSTITSPKTGSR